MPADETGSAGAPAMNVLADGAAPSAAESALSRKALSRKKPKPGLGETRRGRSGPRHGPILGGERDSRIPDGDDVPPRKQRRDLFSTTGGSLQTEETLGCSP